MDDKTQSAKASMSGQAAADNRQTIAEGLHNAGGSAMLDAEVANSEQRLNSPSDQPAATNINQGGGSDDPTRAKNITTTGNYPADMQQLDDERPAYLKDAPANQ